MKLRNCVISQIRRKPVLTVICEIKICSLKFLKIFARTPFSTFSTKVGFQIVNQRYHQNISQITIRSRLVVINEIDIFPLVVGSFSQFAISLFRNFANYNKPTLCSLPQRSSCRVLTALETRLLCSSACKVRGLHHCTAKPSIPRIP